MPDRYLAGYFRLNVLKQKTYDSIQHVRSELYLIQDRNALYLGDMPVMEMFAEVDDFETPYTGDLKPGTFCVRRNFDDDRTVLEARILNDNMEWDTVLPPVVLSINEETPSGDIPTESAVVTFVVEKFNALKNYVDDLSIRMEEALTLTLQAQSSAEDAAATAASAANMAQDSAEMSRSYAVGGTGSRGGEDKDNSKWYYERTKALLAVFNKVVSLPPDQSESTLEECTSTQAPVYTPTYSLPEVTDPTVLHRCIVEVLYSGQVDSCRFIDHDRHEVVPNGSVTVSDGSVVRYTCTYENLLSRWVIEQQLVNP